MLIVSREAERALFALLDDDHERCGVLVGRRRRHASAFVEIKNVADFRRDSFRFCDVAHLEVRRQIRRNGLCVVGIAHSHPHGSAQFSARDRLEMTQGGAALFPEEAFVVVGNSVDGAQMRASHIEELPGRGVQIRDLRICVDG